MKAPRFWAEDGFLPHLLSPVSAVWTMLGRTRRALTTAYRPHVPLICVGNANVGGTGKTPVVQALVAELMELGYRPGILSRGYKAVLSGPVRVDAKSHATVDVGDEPLLHAALAPTVIARDRAAGARLLESLGVDVIVMDDGLQHAGLHPTASLLIIDGGVGIGNGRVMPAGPLREPFADAVSRVSAVAILGEDRMGVAASLPSGPLLFQARIEPLPEAERFRGKRVLAFAGIGRPEKLRETLGDLGAEVVDLVAFPDHHAYDADEIMMLVEQARRQGAELVTTAKDHVRLPAKARGMVALVRVTLVWRRPDDITRWLSTILK